MSTKSIAYSLKQSAYLLQSDEKGGIDLNHARPIRGTYYDIDPMGLFSSIQPSEDVRWGHYFRNTNGKPFIYKLSLISNSNVVLDEIHIMKRWLHPSVKIIQVARDGLYGTIFKPPGPGPFPCIVDVPGINGGKLGTSNAEIFSLSGFLVYTMATFDYKDLPKTIQEVDVEIYSKHIELVKSLPYCSGKVGLYGTSFSGTLAIYLATRHPELGAVVSVNGPESFLRHGGYMRINGKPMNCETLDRDAAEFVNGIHKQKDAFLELFDRLKPGTSIEWKRISKDIPFRIVTSIDDWMLPAVSNALRIKRNLQKVGHPVEMEFIPGGHSKNVPYFPHQPFSYNKFIKLALGFGGETSSHGKSQEIVWKNHMRFFRKHLGPPPSLPNYERETKIELPGKLMNKL